MAKAILELSKMPQSCRECPLQAISEKKIKYCTVIGYSIDYYGTKRRENCPLKPVEDVEALWKAREAIQRAKENFELYGEYEYDVRYDLEEALAEIDRVIATDVKEATL